jgi:hypothetical protein
VFFCLLYGIHVSLDSGLYLKDIMILLKYANNKVFTYGAKQIFERAQSSDQSTIDTPATASITITTIVAAVSSLSSSSSSSCQYFFEIPELVEYAGVAARKSGRVCPLLHQPNDTQVLPPLVLPLSFPIPGTLALGRNVCHVKDIALGPRELAYYYNSVYDRKSMDILATLIQHDRNSSQF